MRIATRVLITACALLIVARFVPGIAVDGLVPAIIAAVCIGICNVLVRPLLILFTLPITIVTLGLFIFWINALLFWFVASFVNGFSVSGFWSAFFGSLIVSAISAIVNRWIE